MTPNSDPVLRVRKWLDKRTSPPPIFKIKKIDTEALRKALRRMKGNNQVHGEIAEALLFSKVLVLFICANISIAWLKLGDPLQAI